MVENAVIDLQQTKKNQRCRTELKVSQQSNGLNMRSCLGNCTTDRLRCNDVDRLFRVDDAETDKC